MTTQLHYTCFESPFGWVGLAQSEKGLTGVTFGATTESAAEARLFDGKDTGQHRKYVPTDARFAGIVEEFQRYFDGQPVAFAAQLDLRTGTPFYQRIWELTRDIPYGEVCSYSWLAGKVGKPKAARAVGGAMRANPLPIVIPCHRVVRNDGGLGGYLGGLHWKRRLLSLEGRDMEKAAISSKLYER